MGEWEGLLRRQDGVITRRHALSFWSEKAIACRLGRQWTVVLPGVYAVQTGPLAERQRHRAALLYAGDGAQLDDVTALRYWRTPYLPADPSIRVLVPATNQRKSHDFVVVRRTHFLPRAFPGPGGVSITPISRALVDFALRYDDERVVRAVLAGAVQRRQVRAFELMSELDHAPSRGRARLLRVLEEIGAGIRSAPEGDVRHLVQSSRILPTPLYNCLLLLPSGRKISPDLLLDEAALIHETNGREPHSDEDPFDDMQERHDVLTTVGFTVLHNSPRLIRRTGPRILHELETIYLRDRGKGLPAGVVMLRRGPA